MRSSQSDPLSGETASPTRDTPEAASGPWAQSRFVSASSTSAPSLDHLEPGGRLERNVMQYAALMSNSVEEAMLSNTYSNRQCQSGKRIQSLKQVTLTVESFASKC